MTKTIEDYFRDWESSTFGFGYGTGEEFTLAALKTFLANCEGEFKSYDYRVLERELTPTVAWLMINILCGTDILDYGTSPRGAWLTPEGANLKSFVDTKTLAELEAICCDHPDDHVGCMRDACNCGDNTVMGRVCDNPFWEKRAAHRSAA